MQNKINENINLQISGEIGQYNSLPIDYLVDISKKLQTLLQTIAKLNVSEFDTINLDNFKIELSGFKTGSAVPQYSFTNRIQNTLNDVSIQRALVKDKFEELLEVADSGQYEQIKKLYPDGFRRNEIVDDLYNFTSSFGDSPVKIVNIFKEGIETKIVPIYNIKKFKKEQRDQLKVNLIENNTVSIAENISYKKVKTITKTNGHKSSKTLEEYSIKNAGLSYSPEVIICEGRVYELTCPLRCLLEKEDDFYTIVCELLDIVGTGLSIEEATESFAQDFDYIYKRYNQISNDNLSTRLQTIKTIINLIVKS